MPELEAGGGEQRPAGREDGLTLQVGHQTEAGGGQQTNWGDGVEVGGDLRVGTESEVLQAELYATVEIPPTILRVLSRADCLPTSSD